MYRCVATSIEGFVQQLAVGYVAHGYWFYVSGWIPEDKDPRKTDAKLIERYGVAVSKWTRCRNKKAGLASVQYLRHGRSFVLLATHGQHPFFVQEPGFRDIREKPVELPAAAKARGAFSRKPGRADGVTGRRAGSGEWLRRCLRPIQAGAK